MQERRGGLTEKGKISIMEKEKITKIERDGENTCEVL